MPKAIWNGQVIADSEATIIVEANHYFPFESVNRELLQESDYHTVCGWKGTASYFDLVVNGQTNERAAWYYPNPKEAVSNIRNHVAFWKGVQIQP